MGYYDDYLEHHGIKGQKWGVRRFENANGTLTAAGRKRYGDRSDKIEKTLQKANKWENRAINAKTSLGRGISETIGANKRMKADLQAAKATGDYKLLTGGFHSNRNMSRNLGAIAESQARVAEGLKKRSEGMSGKKKEKMMDKAVKRLSVAENAESYAKSYKKVADAKGLNKAATKVNEYLKFGGKLRSNSGRQTTAGSRYVENLANSMTFGAASAIADKRYRKKNSANKRWDKIMKGKG